MAVSRFGRLSFCFTLVALNFRPALSGRDCPLETFNLHIIHGRIKYLGSTRGAVARERVDVTNHKSSVEDGVFAEESPLEPEVNAPIHARAKNR